MKKHIKLTINDNEYELLVNPNETLAQLLRGSQINLTGTKQGCELGDCGSCTVLLDGKAVNSCLVLAAQADGCRVTTIEGLSRNGEIHPIQKAFIEQGAVQCGYCTPGFVCTAKALLDKNPNPTEADVRDALGGNLCRCATYQRHPPAVLEAAANLKQKA